MSARPEVEQAAAVVTGRGTDVRDYDGFDLAAHARYVADGGCPWVEDKTWCNGRSGDGHQDHWALYLEPGVKTRRVPLLHASLARARREAQ